MAVEILTVSLSDESIEALATRIVQLVHADQYRNGVATESNPPSAQNPQGAEQPGFQQQADPWLNQNPTPPAQQQMSPVAQVMTGQPQYQPQQQVQQGPPQKFCPHGQMRYVPAGTSAAGRQYNAFYGCPLPKGAPGQCKSVSA